MNKLLMQIAEQYAPENVKAQLAHIAHLSNLERKARAERERTMSDVAASLAVATMPKADDSIFEPLAIPAIG